MGKTDCRRHFEWVRQSARFGQAFPARPNAPPRPFAPRRWQGRVGDTQYAQRYPGAAGYWQVFAAKMPQPACCMAKQAS